MEDILYPYLSILEIEIERDIIPTLFKSDNEIMPTYRCKNPPISYVLCDLHRFGSW
jgi:hypothetical protein